MHAQQGDAAGRRACTSDLKCDPRNPPRNPPPPRIHTAAQCAGTAAQREPPARPSTHSGLQPADARPASRIRHSHAPSGRAPPVTPHPRPDRCRLLACCRARASCRQQHAPAAGSLASHATLPHTPTPATASRAGRQCAALAGRGRCAAARACCRPLQPVPALRLAPAPSLSTLSCASDHSTFKRGLALAGVSGPTHIVQKVHIVRHTRSYAQALRNFASAAAP